METVLLKTAYKSDMDLSELQNWLNDNISQAIRKYGKFVSSQLLIDDDMYIQLIIVLIYI